MARLPRMNVPGIPQHVIQRGNNKQACFHTDRDYFIYMDKLKEYSVQFGVGIHSYVLMTNHVHLLMTPETSDGVSKLMQSLGRYYVRYFNHVNTRTGTLWEGRFKSTLVDSERYFLTVSRYIELNPCRANMVNCPSEYPWSSYQKNVLGKNIELITLHPCYLALGKTKVARQDAYKALFKNQILGSQLEAIRNCTNKSWALGSKRFKNKLEENISRRSSPILRGGDRKSAEFISQRKINLL